MGIYRIAYKLSEKSTTLIWMSIVDGEIREEMNREHAFVPDQYNTGDITWVYQVFEKKESILDKIVNLEAKNKITRSYNVEELIDDQWVHAGVWGYPYKYFEDSVKRMGEL